MECGLPPQGQHAYVQAKLTVIDSRYIMLAAADWPQSLTAFFQL